MKSEWSLCTLGEIVTLQRGFDLPIQNRKHGDFPIVASTGIVGCHSESRVRGPGIVIGRSGSIGGGQYIRTAFWPLNTTLWVMDFHGNDRRFCYYLLRSIDFKKFNVGSGVPTLNRNHIHPLIVSRPPLREQREIGEFLGALDDKIEVLGHTNVALEASAQAIFKSWFIDFDPIQAKSQGLAPVGMDAATAALFPDSFDESELGVIPKGWRSAHMSEVYDVNPSRKLKRDGDTRYVDMASVRTQGHVIDGSISRSAGSGSKFMNGDTLFARITPCLENGKTAFVDFLDDGQVGFGSTEFIVLRPKAPLPHYHAYLLSRHLPFREHAIRSMSGTSGRQRVQNDQLGKFPVVVPTAAVATAFSEMASALQEQIAANHAESVTLASLRDTLLPRLISGKLRIPEAVELVGKSSAGMTA